MESDPLGLPEFTHVARIKVEALLNDGWQVSGYAIQRDGRLGLVTAGAFVGWYTNASESLASAAARITEIEKAVEQAFRDGLAYGSNVENADPDIAWGHSRARAALGNAS